MQRKGSLVVLGLCEQQEYRINVLEGVLARSLVVCTGVDMGSFSSGIHLKLDCSVRTVYFQYQAVFLCIGILTSKGIVPCGCPDKSDIEGYDVQSAGPAVVCNFATG